MQKCDSIPLLLSSTSARDLPSDVLITLYGCWLFYATNQAITFAKSSLVAYVVVRIPRKDLLVHR